MKQAFQIGLRETYAAGGGRDCRAQSRRGRWSLLAEQWVQSYPRLSEERVTVHSNDSGRCSSYRSPPIWSFDDSSIRTAGFNAVCILINFNFLRCRPYELKSSEVKFSWHNLTDLAYRLVAFEYSFNCHSYFCVNLEELKADWVFAEVSFLLRG